MLGHQLFIKAKIKVVGLHPLIFYKEPTKREATAIPSCFFVNNSPAEQRPCLTACSPLSMALVRIAALQHSP